MQTKERFTFFWSGTFSQWHPSPFQIGGVWYNCAEQYMMAEKARLFGDAQAEARIMATSDPSDQKRYGRGVVGFNIDKWANVAKDIVYKASYAKYIQNPEMKRELLATAGTTLVEASPEDHIWGIGLRKTDPRALDRKQWKGTNWLGETLTKVREDLLAPE
jgi:hypothetical protein